MKAIWKEAGGPPLRVTKIDEFEAELEVPCTNEQGKIYYEYQTLELDEIEILEGK